MTNILSDYIVGTNIPVFIDLNRDNRYLNYNLHWPIMTCSSPRRPLFLHALSFECTSKLCIMFLNQFSVYFHI